MKGCRGRGRLGRRRRLGRLLQTHLLHLCLRLGGGLLRLLRPPRPRPRPPATAALADGSLPQRYSIVFKMRGRPGLELTGCRYQVDYEVARLQQEALERAAAPGPPESCCDCCVVLLYGGGGWP